MDRMPYSSKLLTIILPRRAGELLQSLRKDRPRVHAVTNQAAQVFTANLLLAAGAIPSLTFAADEVASFTHHSNALLVNLGTLDGERKRAIHIAIKAARDKNIPWVLDPVFIDASPIRREVALELMASGPDAVRCNGAEFASLSDDQPPSAENVAAFAARHNLIVALSGATDIASDGKRLVQIANGHPLMGLTTAMGCAATALIAAFSTLTADKLEAAAAALLISGVAGEIAAEKAEGPGSFPAHFLDALYCLTPQTIAERARIS